MILSITILLLIGSRPLNAIAVLEHIANAE
jgi:hypothetical protein